uniref:Putative secreted protein n=1 Tax=Anopheles marajoara TaxID=58244 RepID=A0A2M4C845_9DIPT
MLVALGGLGLTIGGVFTSINSSAVSGCPLIGSHSFSTMYFSIRRRSKMAPDLGDIHGCSGTSFEMLQTSDMLIRPVKALSFPSSPPVPYETTLFGWKNFCRNSSDALRLMITLDA